MSMGKINSILREFMVCDTPIDDGIDAILAAKRLFPNDRGASRQFVRAVLEGLLSDDYNHDQARDALVTWRLPETTEIDQ